MPNLSIKNLDTASLYSLSGLRDIDAWFLEEYQLKDQVLALRSSGSEPKSDFILNVAPMLEEFVAKLFYIEDQCQQNYIALNSHQPIIAFKKQFVLKHAKKKLLQIDNIPSWEHLESWRQSMIPGVKDQEWATAKFALAIKDETAKELMINWCARALFERPILIENWVAFKLPSKKNLLSMIDLEHISNALVAKKFKQRQGFDYTDKVMDDRNLQDQVNYCILCHPKKGDFCRIGFPKKKSSSEYKVDELGMALHGCPLEQHISEMNSLMQDGYAIAALAAAMINNPMLAATGNRICHDCMSSCIYQKQTPVDVPNIESAILNMVLNLPWGIEIYYLLLRWNPLRSNQWLPKEFNGHKVAVMGMGPSGFTMAHHLLMEGCAVVGLDGQAMTPMPSSWHKPIFNYQDIKRSLVNRDSKGFGGVAEYGITARWDKNLLSVLRLVLERRSNFSCFSSVRFGGNWQLKDAWRQGFSHVVLAVGAGLPNVPHIPNALASGMRTANDFLMSLHLSNATLPKSFTSLDVRLPALVIGGGLTAVDTATELQAFYLYLVEQVDNLFANQSNSYPDKLAQSLSAADWEQVQIWLKHGKMLKQAKRQAIIKQQAVNVIKLLHEWGGVRIVYRKPLIASPAYRENHNELACAMAEGVLFLENRVPKAIVLDKDGFVAGLDCYLGEQSEVIAAKSVWSAIGSKLNVAYSFEHPGEIEKKADFCYQSYGWHIGEDLKMEEIEHCKDKLNMPHIPIFTSVKVNAGVSFIGDTNPAFHGSVVKAMASAKRGYPSIMNRLKSIKPSLESYDVFRRTISYDFTSEVVATAENWLTIRSPQIARNLQPGMFCRLFTDQSQVLIPAAVDSDLVYFYGKALPKLQVGEKIELMGPTGVRFNVDDYSLPRVWFVDESGLAFVLSLLPFVDSSSLNLILHLDPGEDPRVNKMISKFNYQVAGVNIVESWSSMPHEDDYVEKLAILLSEKKAKEVALFTSPALTMAIKQIVDSAGWVSESARVMGQAMGPMQCALKGVCAQCLQWQIDPVTKKRTKAVYSCSWQHQPLSMIDLKHLVERQGINFSF